MSDHRRPGGASAPEEPRTFDRRRLGLVVLLGVLFVVGALWVLLDSRLPPPDAPDEPPAERPEMAPDGEPEPEPEETARTWERAWASEDLDTLRSWYETNTGLTDPDALGPPSTDPVVSTEAGQTIENQDLRYAGDTNMAIHVMHDDVIVRNNRIRAEGDRNGIWVEAGLSGVVVEHNEIDGSSTDYATDRADGNFGNIGVATRGPVEMIRRNRIFGVRQGAGLHPDTLVEENWVYSLHENAPNVSTSSFGHLSSGGTVIRRNLVEAGTSGGLTVYSQDAGGARDVVFADNLVIGVGEGFGVRGGYSGQHRDDSRDIRIEGNRFWGIFAYPDSLGGGTNAAVNVELDGNIFNDNRWLGNSTNLPARCGVERDGCTR